MKLLHPESAMLRKYVSNIYITESNEQKVNYIAFPNPNMAIGLFRNAVLRETMDGVSIKKSNEQNHICILANLMAGPIKICYENMPDEIAINFKPLGFSSFSGEVIQKNKSSFLFTNWDNDLKGLFDQVFSQNDDETRLGIIENFLCRHFAPVEHEDRLLKAINILSDFTEDYTMTEIAALTGVHYKLLYRNFMKYVGCSPAHFRKISRFKKSVNEKMEKKESSTFTEICYNNNFFDQSYFIKEYRHLTGESPKEFFRNISVPEDGNSVWKYC